MPGFYRQLDNALCPRDLAIAWREGRIDHFNLRGMYGHHPENRRAVPHGIDLESVKSRKAG